MADIIVEKSSLNDKGVDVYISLTTQNVFRRPHKKKRHIGTGHLTFMEALDLTDKLVTVLEQIVEERNKINLLDNLITDAKIIKNTEEALYGYQEEDVDEEELEKYHLEVRLRKLNK